MFAVKLVANLSWRYKILSLSAIFGVGMLFVAGLAGYTVLTMAADLKRIYESTNERVNAATVAHQSILAMAKSLYELIGVSEPAAVRQASVAAIRASSYLDESIQRLDTTLHDNAQVRSLVNLLEEIKPKKMQVIRLARAQEDGQALEILHGMQTESHNIEELAEHIVNAENETMRAMIESQLDKGVNTVMVLGVSVGIGFVLAVLVSIYGAVLITRPMRQLQRATSNVANGDLTVQLPSAGKDEVGQMINAMASMVSDLHSVVSLIQGSVSSLDQESESVAQVVGVLGDTAQKLVSRLDDIKEAVDLVMETTSDAAGTLNQAAEKAAESALVAQGAAEDISVTVEGFRQFQKNMEETARVTAQLEATASTITGITQTIQDISEQTNLLALNAAIEAARAGDQGRGFAVVSDEVRQLAIRTDKATKEISQLVAGITAQVSQTVVLLDKTVKESHGHIARLQQVAQNTQSSGTQVDGLRQAMNQVVNMMERQQQAVAGINQATSSLLVLSSDTNVQTEMLQRLSDSLNSASTELGAVVDKFKL